MNNKNSLQLPVIIAITALASGIRFFGFGIFPPGGAVAFWWRLPTVIAANMTIPVFLILVHRLSRNRLLAYLSAFSLAILPWHIELSRIHSPAMLGLLVLLLSALIFTIAPCKRCKLVLTFATFIVLYRVFEDLWLFHPPYVVPGIPDLLNNLFKVVSVEYLFFRNDSFWLGGVRTTGVLLPSLLPLVLLGLANALIRMKHVSGRNVSIIIFGFSSIILSAASPLFPEQQISLWLTVYLAFFMGNGMVAVWNFYKQGPVFIKIIICVYVAVITYEYILFCHTYIWHTAERIRNEIPYEKRTF